MKAKDLAALAALGVAGFAAYDKFGKKSPAQSGAKAGVKLGESKGDGEAGESEARMNMRDMNEGSGRRDAGGNTEKMSRQERDVPEKIVFRQERDVPDRVSSGGGGMRPSDVGQGGSQVAASGAYKKLKASAANDDADAAAKSLSSTGGPSRYRRDDISEAPAAPASRQFTLPGTQSAMGDFSRAMLPEQRIAAIDAKSGASSPSAKKTEALAALSKAEQAKDVAKKRAAGTFREIPQNVKPAVVKPTAAAPTPPLSAAAAARQRAIDEKNFDSDLMKGRRQAVVDTVKGIPSRVADIFKPPEREFQNKVYRDMSGNMVRYAKGGAVKKMASGGLASSRMSSKPSTASSRGDGIAQRGKTRGQMR